MAKLTLSRIGTAALTRFNRVLTNTLGYQLLKHDPNWLPADFSTEDRDLITFIKPYTLTTPERIFSLRKAVEYVVENRVEGSFVECGVWRGGSVMAMAKTLLSLKEKTRDIYLFDTFEGMSEPTDVDLAYNGDTAKDAMKTLNTWAAVTEEVVQQNISKTGYDKTRLHFVKGKVEDTLPGRAPAKIALLRLDTDWYESTKHELEHLYPRLVCGGVLIIDDYGHFEGARKATDEYFAQQGIKILLNRVDYSARMLIKP